MQLFEGKNQKNIISHQPGLDGLRAIAVIAVIAYHLGMQLMHGGFLGVDLFFVISGFLITSILLTQSKVYGYIDIANFWKKRAKRLLPALLLMLFCTAILIILIAPERLGLVLPEMPAAMFYYSNWYLIYNEVSYFEQFGPPSPFGHLWSLAIEGQFYIIWPILLGLLLRFFKRGQIIAITIAITLVSAVAMASIYVPGLDPSRVYYGTDTRIFAILFGALAAMFLHGKALPDVLPAKKQFWLEIAGMAGLFAVLFMMIKVNEYYSFTYQGGLILFAVIAACLIAVVSHPASILGRLLEAKPIKWIGECSYGIYLWHFPVIVLTSPAVNTTGVDFSLALTQVAITVLLAAVSRYFLEDPVRYGKFKLPALPPLPRSLPVVKPKVVIRFSVIMLSILLIPFALAEKNEPLFAVDHIDQRVSSEAAFAQASARILFKEYDAVIVKRPEKAVYREITGDEITVIGDSVMVGVEPYLAELMPGITVDAKISRQLHKAPEVVSELENAGNLRRIVVIALGTNGPFSDDQLMELLGVLESAEKIIFINTRVPRRWETAVNETFERVLGAYGNVTLIDWYQESRGHNEYFYDDGIHLRPTGAKVYSSLIVESLK